MKVASVEWHIEELAIVKEPFSLLFLIEERLKQAKEEQVDLIIYPGFTGVLYQFLICRAENLLELVKNVREHGRYEDYLEKIIELAKRYQIVICPGSYWVVDDGAIFSTSCVIKDGKCLFEQRQIYLARFERELGLARGIEQKLFEIGGLKVGMIVGSDVFYPQTSRALCLMGAEVVLAPVGFLGLKNPWLQVSGMWSNVQQNQFFAVESAFNGRLGEKSFWGESIIYAPVEMTENQDGFLARTNTISGLISVNLDNEKRKWAISQFDVLRQLNSDFYRQMGLFEVK